MRLQELFLIETTEEDRALISLSSAIYKHLQKYADQDLDYDNDEESLYIGKIGQFFDTPLQGFDNIKLEIQSDIGLLERINNKRALSSKKPIFEAPAGLWNGETNTIVLNADYLSAEYMKSTITHELRHALDDLKSGYEANQSTSYGTPRKKEHRKETNDPYKGNMAYLAQPAEINGRFLQVLDDLVPTISREKCLPFKQARDNLYKVLIYRMERNNIAELFPEKEKSKDYKRLIKRGMDFIEKELAHVQGQQK